MRQNETAKSGLSICKNRHSGKKLEKTVSFVSKVSSKVFKVLINNSL